MAEPSSYSGGPLRGVHTSRIDAVANKGMMLLNFGPEAQCTPSRSVLMTGRYSIRSGNHAVLMPGSHGGSVRWERTLGDIFSDAAYATAIVGKWHIGDSEGRWPTDHGFDEWYDEPRSYDECLWPDDRWYDSERDPVTRPVGLRSQGETKQSGLTPGNRQPSIGPSSTVVFTGSERNICKHCTHLCSCRTAQPFWLLADSGPFFLV